MATSRPSPPGCCARERIRSTTGLCTRSQSLDFLVSCDDFVPKGALCPVFDEPSGVVTVRNLVWPGFMAYTMPGANYWGYCYFGTGEKNADIAFMLP